MDEMDPSISGEDGGTAPDPPLPPPVPGAFRSKKLEFVKSIDAVFKLEVTHCEPWYVRPWTKLRQTRSHSTGFAIDTERRYILTNAHCVDNSVVVQVRKRNVSKSFPAQVLCIGLECDLALLTVPSDEFWSGVHAIKLEDELVEMGDVVDTVGFPKGGEKLCVTNGVVSRVDLSGYYLAIQIDAAINSGNSGGPVLNDKQACVGVAYKKLADAKTDNISYIIPIEVVRHFLTDYAKHGRYTGVAELCFIWQPLENDGLRRSLGMQEGQSGIRVTSVLPWSQARDVLQVGDLILKIDGQKIENVGKVPFHDGEFISLDYLISCKFPGDVCVVELLRGTELLTVSYELPAINPLVPRKPATLDYFIVGGLVFLPLSQALAASTKRKLLGVCAASMTTVVLNVKSRLDEEIVVLGDVLRHQLNVGFTWRAYSRVISFNGVAIINLRHLITLVQSCDTEWMRFELDDLGQQLILLNSKDVAAAQDDILSSNNIPAAFRPPDADSA